MEHPTGTVPPVTIDDRELAEVTRRVSVYCTRTLAAIGCLLVLDAPFLFWGLTTTAAAALLLGLVILAFLAWVGVVAAAGIRQQYNGMFRELWDAVSRSFRAPFSREARSAARRSLADMFHWR